MSKKVDDADKLLDEIYALSEDIEDHCEGVEHYTAMCALIEVLSSVLLEMESFEEYQEQGNYPGQLFARIFNSIMATKRDIKELEDAEEEKEGQTIH